MTPEPSHKCPSCGYEYEPWIKTCPDCGVLVENIAPRLELIRSGGLDRDTDPEWTVAANVPNAIIGNVIKNQLEDAGIPVLMLRSSSADIGEFSHNDYVSHDLRVPADRREEARQLIYGETDMQFGSSWEPWDEDELDGDQAEEQDPETESEYSGTSQVGRLPDGWSMLPTEADLRLTQQRRRARLNDDGWHWTDVRRAQFGNTPQDDLDLPDYGASSDIGPHPIEFKSRRRAGPYESDYGEPIGSSKWVRILYGILIGSLTVPFLFQLLGEISSIFTGR